MWGFLQFLKPEEGFEVLVRLWGLNREVDTNAGKAVLYINSNRGTFMKKKESIEDSKIEDRQGKE